MDKNFTLFIGGIPKELTENQVLESLKKHKPIKSIRLVLDRRLKLNRGYGFFDVFTHEDFLFFEHKMINIQGTLCKCNPSLIEKVQGNATISARPEFCYNKQVYLLNMPKNWKQLPIFAEIRKLGQVKGKIRLTEMHLDQTILPICYVDVSSVKERKRIIKEKCFKFNDHPIYFSHRVDVKSIFRKLKEESSEITHPISSKLLEVKGKSPSPSPAQIPTIEEVAGFSEQPTMLDVPSSPQSPITPKDTLAKVSTSKKRKLKVKWNWDTELNFKNHNCTSTLSTLISKLNSFSTSSIQYKFNLQQAQKIQKMRGLVPMISSGTPPFYIVNYPSIIR